MKNPRIRYAHAITGLFKVMIHLSCSGASNTLLVSAARRSWGPSGSRSMASRRKRGPVAFRPRLSAGLALSHTLNRRKATVLQKRAVRLHLQKNYDSKERPHWVVSGPSELYHLKGRYRGQSGTQKSWKLKISTAAFGQMRPLFRGNNRSVIFPFNIRTFELKNPHSSDFQHQYRGLYFPLNQLRPKFSAQHRKNQRERNDYFWLKSVFHRLS